MPDTKTAKALREQRATLAATISQMADKIHAEGRDFNAEEKPNWEKVNADYNVLSQRIAVAERVESVTADQGSQRGENLPGRENRDGRQQPGDGREAVTEEHRAIAFQAWMRSQMDMEVTEEQAEICRRVGLNPNARQLEFNLLNTRHHGELQRKFRSIHPTRAMDEIQSRALSATVGSEGGNLTLPETLIRNLEVAMLAFGGVAQVAETIRTESGEEMAWPTANDTGNRGRRLGENQAVDTTDTQTAKPTIGRTVWRAHKYTSDAILVPSELLEDSAFDLPVTLGGMLGERVGRITNYENTVGTGGSMPNGIVNAATLGKTAAGAAAITADELMDLEHSVDPAYRIGAGWMMHDNVLLAVRKLKDSQNRYLWTSGLDVGAPDKLSGHPITINQDMASALVTTAKTVLFGQLSKYKIRQVRGIRIYRLQERYRDNDQDGFVAFLRQDGNLLNAGTNPIKYLQQA